MQVQTVVRLISVKQGKTKNWIEFEAYAGALDYNRIFKIEFCGTEIKHGLSLTDEQLEQLKDKICADFGYAPFDLKKAKQILGKGKDYTLIHGIADN